MPVIRFQWRIKLLFLVISEYIKIMGIIKTSVLYILMGGDGSRMNLGYTKALLSIPYKDSGVQETLLSRTFRLLDVVCKRNGWYEHRESVGLVTGYKSEVVRDLYPFYVHKVVNNFQNEVMDGIRQVHWKEASSFRYIHGDVVWSQSALEEFLSLEYDFVFYSDSDCDYGEIFALSVRGDAAENFQECLESDILLAEPNVNLAPIDANLKFYKRIERCKLWDLYSHAKTFYGAVKYKASFPVQDIDSLSEYEMVCQMLREGKFD